MIKLPNGGAAPKASTAKDILQKRLQPEWREMARDWAKSWKDVISGKYVASDLIAGVTVTAVALPLNLGLAIASGLPPSTGLIAGVVGGGIAAMFGGAPLQVSGPAAALSVMVAAIATTYGAPGVALAAFLIGIMQLFLSLSTTGRLMEHVPESVLAGFTTGVGLKLLDDQIPKLLGFGYKTIDIATAMHRPHWLHEVSWISVVSGLSVAMLIMSMQRYKRFPAALVGIVIVTAVASYVKWDVKTVGELGDIPSRLPSPKLTLIEDEQWLDFLVKVVPLGLLASVESLLSARTVKRMAPDSMDPNPNLELFGQGLANLASGVFQAMPVSGVVVRTGVNVQSGGRTRIASVARALGLLMTMLFLSQQIELVPLAALAGLLCITAVRLIEVSTLYALYRESKLDALAFVVTAAGTVSGHLMMGLIGGLATHFVGLRFHRTENALRAQVASDRKQGIRATLDREHARARRPNIHAPRAPHANWLSQIRERAHFAQTSFVHEQATIIGRVVLGDEVHIAAGASVRADEGAPFFIGSHSNLQDGVVVHALKDKKVIVAGEPWAVYVGKNVSIAHDALVHGPCYIGDNTFVGFKAVVHDSIVGAHCFIGIGAVVVGVEVPDGRFVPHGRIVDSADAVDALPLASESHLEFNEDVVEVNRGLAAAYREDRKVPAPIAAPGHELDDDWAKPSLNEPVRF